MCDVVGADYIKDMTPNVTGFDLMYSWTTEQKYEFTQWLSDYLYTNKEARFEIMNEPIRNKELCEITANAFVFNYGWSVDDEQ